MVAMAMGRSAMIGARPPSRGPTDEELARMPKRRIEIRQTRGAIPEKLFEEFIRDSGNIPKDEIEAAKTAKIKLIAYHKGQVVGFICGNAQAQEKVIVLKGFYVKENYRRQRAGPALFEHMDAAAKRRNFIGLDMHNITEATAGFLEKRRRKLSERKMRKRAGEIQPEQRIRGVPQSARIRFQLQRKTRRR